MNSTKRQINTRESFIIFGVIAFLWIVPWGKVIYLDGNLYMTFFVDMFKLGIALGLFIVPGALLYVLLRRGDDSPFGLLEILPVGFALSVTIISLIGILGRVLGLSFGLVRSLFMLIGLGELILLPFIRPNFVIPKSYFRGVFRSIFENFPLLLALILATSVTFNGYQFFIDDTSYAAYLMNWQHSPHLGFLNLVHQVGAIEESRFWLALYPMSQALLSNLSGVPGILLYSNYLELFLVPLAVITSYWFMRSLDLSRKIAGIAVLVQVLFYVLMIDDAWPVGFWFFENMIEDKVSAVFLLAPVFFFFVMKFLQLPTRKNLLFVFLSGLGLMLTHPVILFLSCTIAGGLAVIGWTLKKTSWRYLLQLIIAFVIVMLPYVTIRYFGRHSQSIPFDAESVSTTFQADRYVSVVNNIFYGLNPDVLKLVDIPSEGVSYYIIQVFRLLPVFLVLIAAVLAFHKLREGSLYWYIVTCALLVAFAAIPYTGWILGYFISARMLSRVSWFSPLGLASALIVTLIIELTPPNLFRKPENSSGNNNNKAGGVARGVMAGLAAIGILFVGLLFPNAYNYFNVLDHNRQLSQVGKYIDQNTNRPTTVMALDYADIQMLPSVSVHASLISFREEKEYNPHNYFLPLDEIHNRMYASNTIRSLDPSIPAEERCDLLNGYNVKFVLAGTDTAELFTKLTSVCGIGFSPAYKTKDIILLESQ